MPDPRTKVLDAIAASLTTAFNSANSGDRTSARFYRVQAAGIGLGYLLGTGGTADDLAGLLNEARDLMPHRHQEAAS